jgi:hypothetical protein
MEAGTSLPQHPRTKRRGYEETIMTNGYPVNGKRGREWVACAAAAIAFAVCIAPPASGAKAKAPVFESTWKDPEAQPMQVKGAKVVAAVIIQDPKARKKAEDALAKEITKRGGKGVPMYTLSLSDAATTDDESKTRAAVEAIGAQGIVVMRPVDVRHKAVTTETISKDDTYGGYWGGYYGIGWSDPWVSKSPDLETDIVVTVEVFVFSLPQNKLVWTGTSESTNPPNAEKLVLKLASEAAKELKKEGLIAP